jgi:uncharacterized protein YndB with AHSA1/START domain
MTHPFEISFELTLPATPEQVWQAIATGPGFDSWFMGRNEVEPREGGGASMDTGGHRSEATVTAYEPGKRFGLRTATSDDGRFMAFEYLLEARDGGATVLRLVHSGLLGDDWENEYDALRRGWPFHLNTLVEYLTHFAGRTAVPVFAAAPWNGRSADQVREALGRGLSLSLPAVVGSGASAKPAGAPPLDGEVVWADDEMLAVRSSDALCCFVSISGVAMLSHHLFGPDTDGAQAGWQQWLTDLLA